MARLRASSPWVVYYREIAELFKYDPDVGVIYDEEENEVKLYVDGQEKAEALAQLLPSQKIFGNVALTIKVIPANKDVLHKVPAAELFMEAFRGNPILSYIQTVGGISSNTYTYIVFIKKVAQYWTDNLGDINGVTSSLYQDIAYDVFTCRDGVFFCTDTDDDTVEMEPCWP